MADLGPRDRLDIPIWNAIDAHNFKQALKYVDKRLAKKPSEYLDALRIYIRARSSILSENTAVLLCIEELAAKKVAIKDLEAIDLYDEALREVLREQDKSWGKAIGELRWQYVKSNPKDEHNILKCFQVCLAKGDLDHARQIANTLEKSFPNNHAYVFWNISTMFLYATSNECPEVQKKIWGGLAHGQITKLAAATRQLTDPAKLPLRAIHTPQEILLLLRITKEYGTIEQRLEYLADALLGPDSAVAKGEWELWRIRLQLLEENRQWQELFDITTSLLDRARTKDASGKIAEPGMSDWLVWEAFLKSAIRLEGHKQKPVVLQELEAHLDPESGIDKTWRRNASLAWVKFCFKTATPFSVIPGPDGMGQVLNHIPILFKYLQKWGDVSASYNDLKPFVARLDAQERSQLLKVLIHSDVYTTTMRKSESKPSQGSLGALGEDLSTASSITQTINVYKLRYLLVSSLPEHERRQSPQFDQQSSSFQCVVCLASCGEFCEACLRQISLDSTASYKAAINDDGSITKNLLSTDRHPADDLCILSAMCLIKLSLVNQDTEVELLSRDRTAYLLQAIMLLEFGWLRSKSNFQFSLLLIRLYTNLGCGSLAARAYHRLSPKQIQLDTLAYTLFDRISSQHPHDITHVPEDLSPPKGHQELIRKQQKVYRNAREQIAKNMWLSFKQSNYNSVFEMQKAADALSKTLAGAMSVVESRKITRLTEPGLALDGLSGGYNILQKDPEISGATFVDTNDYATFPNFESSEGTTFEELTRFAPKPTTGRVQAGLIAEKLKQIISPSSPEDEKPGLMLWLQDHVKTHTGSDLVGTYTRSEELAKQAEEAIASLVREVGDKSRWTDEKFQARLDSSNVALQQAINDLTSLVDGQKHIVPAFWNTLHTLYTAYDVVRTTSDFSNYISRHAKTIPDAIKELGKSHLETVQGLLNVVLEKVQHVKKGLDEGGWIDKVLDGSLTETGGPQATGEAIKGLVDEYFLEEWAGLVVESWGESVQGLSLIKPLK